MNKKQWFVLGIGLILLSFFLSFVSNINDCSDIQNSSIANQLKLSEAEDSTQEIQAVNMDAWVISCFDTNIVIQAISTIIFTLGVIFVIFGFLEPKKHQD